MICLAPEAEAMASGRVSRDIGLPVGTIVVPFWGYLIGFSI